MRFTLISSLVLIGTLSASAASSQTVLREAEWYTQEYDLGGYPISRVSCIYAHGGKAVDYIDVLGEWILLEEITFPADGWYSDSLCCAARGLATRSRIFRQVCVF